MRLTSPAFKQNASIPAKYACEGEDISPPLAFHDVPSGTISFVLVMDDPDIPGFVREKFGISKFDHWVVFNIPPATRIVSEGKNPPGIVGINSAGKSDYSGPCPPDKEHRYFFRLYALNCMLEIPPTSTLDEVERAIQSHVLARADLMGRYAKK